MDQTIISAIIIDDEPQAINLLEMYLRGFPLIQVVGTENDAKKGLELAIETIPELIFLDIDMPDMNGLAFAKKLQSENFYSEIVFTTAYQHYAYDALNIEPLDFLTKPFSASDLEVVMQKYKAKKEREKQDKKLEELINKQANTQKIKLPTTTGILFVDVKNIVLLRTKSNNCELRLNDGSVEVITRNLNNVISLLNSHFFFQTSRSTYINLNYLQRVDKKKSKCTIYFNQTVIEESISRSNMSLFEKAIKFPNIQE